MSLEYCNINSSPSIAQTNTMYSTSPIEVSFQSADTIPTTEYYFTRTITVTASNCVQDVSNTQTGIILYC